MIGQRLSHYEILDEISRGGMGVVYRARDLNLDREVALKVLPEALVHDRDRRERLLHEARAASALEHPHIAVIHDVGEADGVTFIAMELIRGEKMRDALSRGPLPPKRALDLAMEIAEGLARAHEKGLIHRDLKPANVMVTEDGHAKIIDFGLAKLIEPVSHEASTATVPDPRTAPGVVLGTAAYMSPEQARGARVDRRSDIFSLGVVLYEMLTGRAAFQGATSLDTMQAILTQPAPPLPAIAGAPGPAIADLQRIIDKCTAKDADDRYHGMKDLVVDLRAARRHLESMSGVSIADFGAGAIVAPASKPRRVRSSTIVAAVVVTVALAVGVAWWATRGQAPARSSSGKPAIAVLYFENNTGDASLDWMRTGLADMMVTDLSQSTDFEVIGTDRLYQILQELRRTDDRVIPADVVQQVANRAAVDNVLLGSYVRAGDTIRIDARLQEARTGRVVTSERVEGRGESSLFSLVDELTRRIKSKVAGAARAAAPGKLIAKPGGTPAPGLDRDLTDVTTSSIEAYRLYAEGMSFHERGLSSQAAPLFEKAIKVDPNFGMAYAKLAVVYNNMGLVAERDRYAQLALRHVTRLTTRERYYIEGFYYTLRPETISRGIEAYKQGLVLHPEHHASRHNLGLQYFQLERFPEAIEQYNELLRRGTTTATTYGNLAGCHLAIGEVGRARELMEEFARRYPESPIAWRSVGSVLVVEGRLDEARLAFEKSQALYPSLFQARLGRLTVAALQERWADAESVLKEFAGLPAAINQVLTVAIGTDLLAGRGRGREALDLLERGIRMDAVTPDDRAYFRNRQALMLLRQGKPTNALAYLQAALADARNTDTEFETFQLLAVAQAAAGRQAESQKTLALLQSRAAILPSAREMRRVHWARGEIALGQGDTTTAVAELMKAQATLPVNGPVLGPPAAHPTLWLAAATAHIKAARDAEAVKLLERLQSGHERIFDLEAYARSFFLLGQIYERRGDAAKAREQYSRFVALWRDGDLERGWVAEAQRKLAR